MDQPDLFAADAPPPSAYRPDPEKVRARLGRILEEARAAEALPWAPARASLYRTIVPDMSRLLPRHEGERLRDAFEAEMARLAEAAG